MSINKLPTIKSYWECGEFTENDDIRNVMAGSIFGDILQNLEFLDNTKDDKSDKHYKDRSLIKHFNHGFSNFVLNDSSHIIDKHMAKFKGLSSMKWYVKNKPIKWGLKFWYRCRCGSETVYLYQFDFYLDKNEISEENLRPGNDWIPSKQSLYVTVYIYTYIYIFFFSRN